MISNYLRLRLPIKDSEFDAIYPIELRGLSERHFTEVEVAIKAIEFLANKPNQKILDIGSGVGKFCFVAGAYSNSQITGVEYRKQYVELCDELIDLYRFNNVNFIHSDIKKIDFKKFDNFYFFNPFQEHLDATAIMDDTILTSKQKFTDYTEFVRYELDKLPTGTRIATYYAHNNQIPRSFNLVSIHFDRSLKCWEKTSEPIIKFM